MSKAFLKQRLKDKKIGNFYFPSIRQEWARESVVKSQEWEWSENINPSSTWLTFRGCPYEGIKEAAEGKEPFEADFLQYGQMGNYLHRMFQESAMKIPGLLWPKPVFATEKEQEKLEKNWPEVPFFLKEYDLSGRIDHILNYKEEACVIDIKIPQREDTDRWQKYKESLPEETHWTQSAMGALAMKKMGLVDVKWIGVVYFNPYIPAKGNLGYMEFYQEFTEELEAKTLLLLQHAKKERDLHLAGVESQCTYPLCKKHHGK